MTEFIKAADLSDIREGKLYPVDIDGEPVCLTKIDGTIYAFSDNCTHISGPLNRGELDGCVITCPLHGARFDITNGKVLRGPARYDLITFPVKIEENSVLVGLPDDE
ncbi:3-phenylpropionate/trans-cinnamate dioxygenase ferredoxin subunit [Thermosporothrix hazakensis]|jgi:nitrite reductase/ring-hydroxylating ferredoxin subunit|uniref:3-phenylpropionate/trans-cinnamate dioxygenase ferredoxin subunit n=2 Tax=Thermosporothrix TaxID=768650 RepID=A0A326U2W9_THEHA|nr:non-heme iron oxygenase ferredoxin subunit [Thermosporothrix hazakensis]PZW22986.1 3-phenylpropionate/trans-cinnamate dioxygenase ferredoxin subunit [Thermosporothrix hazakensis]BBH90077.1 (2Fe-2S)-binding protein [Thermosporothrix sp. COM3]GCE48298.1 (2Fe-2S)-binding protein [Thermosporothrix hazakensis]